MKKLFLFFLLAARVLAQQDNVQADRITGLLGRPTTFLTNTTNGAQIYTAAGFPSQTGNSGKVLTTNGSAMSWAAAGSGSGTVTSVSVTTANGVSGSVATSTTTPAITLTLGAITPTTVNGNTFTTGTGTLTLGAGKTLTASNTLTFTGTDSSSVAFGAGGTVLYSGGSYVSSLAGTANQIDASGSTGAVTLSIPSTFIAPGSIAATTGVSGTTGTFSALTSGRVPIVSTAGLLGDDAGLTYSTATDTLSLVGVGSILKVGIQPSFVDAQIIQANGTSSDGAPVFLMRDDGTNNLASGNILGSIDFGGRFNSSVNDVAKMRGYYMGDGTTRTGKVDFLIREAGNGRVPLTLSGLSVLVGEAIAGSMNVRFTDASTSTTTGSGVFGGGIGVAGAGYFGGILSTTQLTSTVATGAPPLVVASTTLVSNLHAATADAAPASGLTGLGANVATWLATPSFANLNVALSGDDAAGLAANNLFTGINAQAGAAVTTANALTSGTVIDVTKSLNTHDTLAAPITLTFSGTPSSSNQWFSLLLAADGTARVATIPSSFSIQQQTAITSVTVPASGKLLLTWQYDGSVYNLYGDPAPTTGTGNFVKSASPTLTGTIGAASATFSSLTATRVTFAGASGLLADDADMTFATDTLTITKVSTPTIEMGSAATDTTITRSAAGVIAVESVVIPSISSTNTLTNKKVQVSAALGSDDTYDATLEVAGLNAGATIAQWEAVYLGGSSTWLLADANGSSTYPAWGLAVAAYSNTNPAIIVTVGTVRNDAWNWTPGGNIYLSTTAGALTQTAPSTTGDKVQVIGKALTADIMLVGPGTDYGTAP